MPERIQLRRTKGWRKPKDAISVYRGTIWGNPFRVGDPSGHSFNDGGDPTPMITALTRAQAIEFYRDLINGFLSPEMHPAGHEWRDKFAKKMRGFHPRDAVRSYLRGHDLCCWCGLDEDCHADVLLRIANE